MQYSNVRLFLQCLWGWGVMNSLGHRCNFSQQRHWLEQPHYEKTSVSITCAFSLWPTDRATGLPSSQSGSLALNFCKQVHFYMLHLKDWVKLKHQQSRLQFRLGHKTENLHNAAFVDCIYFALSTGLSHCSEQIRSVKLGRHPWQQ